MFILFIFGICKFEEEEKKKKNAALTTVYLYLQKNTIKRSYQGS